MSISSKNEDQQSNASSSAMSSSDLSAKYTKLAFTCRKNHQLKESLEYCDKAIQCDAYNIQAWSNKARCLDKQGNISEAIRCYKMVIDINPNIASIWNYLGCAYLKQQKFKKSLAAYREAIKIQPNSDSTLYNMGYILEKQGDYQSAYECYSKAHELQPENEKYATAKVSAEALWKDFQFTFHNPTSEPGTDTAKSSNLQQSSHKPSSSITVQNSSKYIQEHTYNSPTPWIPVGTVQNHESVPTHSSTSAKKIESKNFFDRSNSNCSEPTAGVGLEAILDLNTLKPQLGPGFAYSQSSLNGNNGYKNQASGIEHQFTSDNNEEKPRSNNGDIQPPNSPDNKSAKKVLQPSSSHHHLHHQNLYHLPNAKDGSGCCDFYNDDMTSSYPAPTAIATGNNINTNLFNSLQSYLSKVESLPELIKAQVRLEEILESLSNKIKFLHEKSTKESQDKCAVCWDRPAEMVSIPCGHLCLCQECKSKLRQKKCPICGQVVKNIYKVWK